MTARFFSSAPLLALSLFALASPITASAGEWPWWRGPDRNGVAEAGQTPPTKLGVEENVKWATDIAGRAHGSPCVIGERVFIATADEDKKTQSMLCIDRESGKQIWSTVIHRDGMTQKSNKKASWASPSPACDGDLVFINFVTGDAAFATALDLDGKQVWQTKITDYVIHQGYGASPAIYKNLVIVVADNKKDGALCGLDRKTGEVVWKVKRGPKENYPSPIILEIDGKDQLFLTGIGKVSSYDPLTGDLNWECEGATTECVTSTVTDGERIFTSGGYPKNHVAAVEADGSGKIAWEHNEKVYVPSMLIRDGYLYAVMDSGVAVCWKSDTGEEMWKERLGGPFSASPVMVNDQIYAASEKGELIVFRATPEKLEVLAKNQIGDEVLSSPIVCDSEIYVRVAFYEGEKRSEKLICYGKK